MKEASLMRGFFSAWYGSDTFHTYAIYSVPGDLPIAYEGKTSAELGDILVKGV